MKNSTVIIAALTLIVVFVGGISASDLVESRPAEQIDAGVSTEINLDQLIGTEIDQDGEIVGRANYFAESVQDDYEIPM